MFTGIIGAIGTVREVVTSARDTRSSDRSRAGAAGVGLVIEAPWSDVALGESIAVDGACLTVERTGPGWFSVHVIATSLARTAFGEYRSGRRVNLERALRMGDRLGGHLVQGHVDAIGTIARLTDRDDTRVVDIAVPAEVATVTISLGSIAVDGVSLTVNAMVAPGIVQVSLIPFTLEHTTLCERVAGDSVHLEGDTVGKYLKQLSAAWRGTEPA